MMRSVVNRVDRRSVLGAAAMVASGCLLGSGPARAVRSADPAHVDVLFIGAHPDDEHVNIATFGQWREYHGLTTGVVTITRGEGGGNAVGKQEGPQLGLIRETEERRATALAGISDIYYLDKPDFWYTLSAPLTARVWHRADTLVRLVRLVRETTPHTIVVMDPRPFNQHGGHQLSARLGIEAFLLAGEESAFTAVLHSEGLRPWQPTRLLAQHSGSATEPARGEGDPGAVLGPDAVRVPRIDSHTGLPLLGVWTGTWSSEHGCRWAQVQRNAARMYRTQGFAALPSRVPTAPERLGSDWLTVLADHGRIIAAPVRHQPGLRPVYAEFRDWTNRVGLPWLANEAAPDYPPNPATAIPVADVRPVVNGIQGPGEYPGPRLPLRHWQGSRPAGFAAHAKVSRHGDDLFFLVTVADRREGAALDRDDIKRHWRTDSVEIDLDPRGDADDTSTTFKIGILPFTAHDGGPAAERDADNHQGPAAVTAPGVQVASVVGHPYRGYTVEVRIPLAVLPAAADPSSFAMNIEVYDSDTADETGQARYAWSPFGSAQADPYVWGRAVLMGYRPPTEPNIGSPAPVIPNAAARSVDSPAARAQQRRTGVPMAGNAH